MCQFFNKPFLIKIKLSMRLLCIDRFVGKCRSIDTQNYDQLVVKQQHNDVIIKIRETAYEQNDIKVQNKIFFKFQNISLNF